MPKKRRRPSSRRPPASASPARTRKIKRYGWIPDIPDQRDYLYAAPPAFLRALPARIDLRKQCPPVYDQGQLGSCTANAVGGAIEFDQMKEKLPQIFIPSRLFIYYNEHVLGGHAVCAVGYDIKRRWFICRNSWGTTWGMRGYFSIPFAYLTDADLSADFWTIRVVE